MTVGIVAVAPFVALGDLGELETFELPLSEVTPCFHFLQPSTECRRQVTDVVNEITLLQLVI